MGIIWIVDFDGQMLKLVRRNFLFQVSMLKLIGGAGKDQSQLVLLELARLGKLVQQTGDKLPAAGDSAVQRNSDPVTWNKYLGKGWKSKWLGHRCGHRCSRVFQGCRGNGREFQVQYRIWNLHVEDFLVANTKVLEHGSSKRRDGETKSFFSILAVVN